MAFLGKDYKKGIRQREGQLTCVIGAYCAEGCVIISDRRVLRRYEATEESKVRELWGRSVIAGAGTAILLDKLTNSLSKSNIPDSPNFDKTLTIVENAVSKLHKRYYPRLEVDYNLQAIMMGLREFDKGDTYIHLIHGEGISEEIRTFVIIGHAAQYVAPLFRLLYSNMLTVTELAVLGYFTMSTIITMGLDQTIGVTSHGPDMVALRPDEKPYFLTPQDQDFSTARASLKELQFKFSLVKKIWSRIPQAYETTEPQLL